MSRRGLANYAPIRFERCPVHGSKVAADGDGRLLGICDGCAVEAAVGLLWLKQNRTPLKGRLRIA